MDQRELTLSGLTTDLYELTMMQGYVLSDMNLPVVFDMFFRTQPFGGGFSVFAGLNDLLTRLEHIEFSDEDISFLEGLGLFQDEFLAYLKNFEFTGTIHAVAEGSIVFPGEPLIRVEARLAEAQLIESVLLNIINFQTLVATKTARVFSASGNGRILEFGLRRAQGLDGAFSATRAAFIGGASATSNTYAGKVLGIPVKGTMAHSWIMAFPSEEDAFRCYAELYPDSTIFLIDTYDTMKSGLPNAMKVGRELKDKGKSFGVRLDSGDLQYLSSQVRKRLDAEGLEDAFITVSNELDEQIVQQLVKDGAPVDAWGVGTKLVTGGEHSSLTGVYKLSAKSEAGRMQPVIKLSDNPQKTTDPGVKQVHRFHDENGTPLADMVCLDGESIELGETHVLYHPQLEAQFELSDYAEIVPLLQPVMIEGRRAEPAPSLSSIQEHVVDGLKRLHGTHKRLINPHRYKVSLSGALKELKVSLIRARQSRR